MSEVAEKTISALVDRQLPGFIRSDHPKFKRFLELYYAWLEDESKGNTVYHIMRAGEYRDIDSTLDPFVRMFKLELLPYFPETSSLDLVKILKGAREFYSKKGSEESVKWLFRVLFGEDVNVFYPKKQILIASDGKWKLPQAFQLTISEENQDIDVRLLKGHKATGSISKATCIIESADRSIDRTFGTEILEMYVSNVEKAFVSGEDLEIPYTDENGVELVFSERIIGSISNIFVDSNIKTDPQQKRRGLLYNIGDPVVVFGGLARTANAQTAVAVVGNVTVGSIEGLGVTFPGYGYRVYSNTEVVVYRSVSDDPNANQSVDIRVAGITTILTSNSQNSFLEFIDVDKLPIEYMANTLISAGDYSVLTQNNRNIVLAVNNNGNPWYNNELVYANGASYATANFTAQVLTANTGWAGGPQNIILYNVANTQPLTTTGFLIGVAKLISTNSGSTFNVTSVVASSLAANSDSQFIQAIKFVRLETGGVALYNIINGGYGFRTTPQVVTSSYFDTFLSENYAYGTPEQANFRQPMGVFGKIAHVYINNPGTGYANGDAIHVTGRGYDFAGYVNVGAAGVITKTTITNRGDGYYGESVVTVTSSGGSNCSLTAYGFGEGVEIGVETGAIGRVKDVRMISRGFDYIETPNVSFKVVDMVISGISDSESLPEGTRVYQGASLETAIFQGIIKSYNRSTKLLRLYNYSGNSFSNFNETLPLTSEDSVTFTINTSANVPAPSLYPSTVVATGLPNPWFYGNGKAKGYAEFFNGLIKFNGFYLNTDGFLSADKKIQDGHLYHNFSYIIETEKSLRDYENVMKDVVHPAGTIMFGYLISKSDQSGLLNPTAHTSVNPAVQTGSTITIANSKNVVITGTSTLFNSQANVGDMIWLKDYDNELRSFVKTIVARNSNTSLNVDSNFLYVGQGKLATNGGNNLVIVSSNSNVISDFIQTSDKLRMNVNNTVIEKLVTGISGNTITLNSSISTSNTSVVYLVVPDYTANYAYEIIKKES
jgi:hypothetical protein